MARQTRSTPKSKTATRVRTRTTPKTVPKRSQRPKRNIKKPSNERSKYFDSTTDEDDSTFDELDSSDSDEEDSFTSESEEDEPPAKKIKVAPKKSVNGSISKKAIAKSPDGRKKKEQSEELWETFVPKEDTPDTGDIPYEDSCIHPNTLLFLAELVENNDRDWFWSHEKRYRVAENDWKTFVEVLSTKLQEVDTTIPPLPLKDIIFRIYRDVRFSNDKTLYKDHFSAAWSRTGRKGPYAAYYLHLQPGDRSFIGLLSEKAIAYFSGGKWHPDAGHLARIRHTILNRPGKFKKPILKPKFKKQFGGMSGLLTCEDKLKTAPKGVPKDHEDIELLKLKSIRVHSRFFTDKEVMSDDFMDLCVDTLKGMVEFVTMLNDVCMPDESDSDTDEDADDEEADDE